MVKQIRRVVTAQNSDGKSEFIIDEMATSVKEMESMPGLALTDIWVTNSSPANNEGSNDTADRPIALEPPKNGTIFRVVEFPPDSAWRDSADAQEAFDSIGAGHASDKKSSDPMMHKTSTVDYLIVLQGEIWAILDDSEVWLKAGDVMVQRGTTHSWSVRTDEPCLLVAILVDAEPI